MIGFSLVIADSKRDIPVIEPGPLGSHTSALTTKLQEVRHFICQKIEVVFKFIKTEDHLSFAKKLMSSSNLGPYILL